MVRKISLLLAVALFAAVFTPLQGHAAQTEQLVLRTTKNANGGTRYTYDADGNCIREEGMTNTSRTEYVYNEIGSLVEEKTYKNNRLEKQVSYDHLGKQTASWITDSKGALVQNLEVTLWYDAYGRLIGSASTNPRIKGSWITNLRYEYEDTPKSVFFGHYEQDGNTENGPEPIEWLILDADADKLLVISKYALDSRRYHTKQTGVSWEKSDLRAWLNDGFLSAAFDRAEQNQISQIGTRKNVVDRVFLLSLEEVKEYFPDNDSRLCQATQYAVKQNAYVNGKTGGSWWLLRTPGETASDVMSINSDGTIDYDGGSVSGDRGSLRPAMWVSNTVLKDSEDTICRLHKNVYYVDPVTNETAYRESNLLTYNDQGKLSCNQDYITGEMQEWDYDDKGNVVKYQALNIDLMYNEISTHIYNKAGYLVRTDTVATYMTKEGEISSEKWAIEYRYDSKGRMTFQEETNSDGSSETQLWTYDGKGNNTSYEKRMNGKTVSKETREYDGYGNLLKITQGGRVVEENTYVPLSQALR